MREGKDHMEVGGVNNLGPAPVHPEFLLDGLAVGAAAVAAGIIVELQMPAVRTDRNIAPQFSGLFYYESFGLFAVLILVQLAATGEAAFRVYNKQRKD